MQQRSFHLLILLIVCGLTFWLKAGSRDFWGRHGEARRAEISREMAASGAWIVPHLNGEPFVTKPPLYYWAAALAFKLTGNFDEFSARMPSLICGTLGVFVTYFWASAAFSPHVGLLSGIILATNFLYAGMARTAGVDMMLTLFITTALWCLTPGVQNLFCHVSQDKSCTPGYLLAAIWIGLGTMTKNPIGFAVPVLAMAGFILISKNFKLILDLKPWRGLLIVLLIVLPWVLLVYQRVPNFFEVVRQETLGRYTDPEDTPHLAPFYYYIPALGAFAPWVMFLPGMLIALISKRRPQMASPHLFLIIALSTTFLLFSSVGSKREYYLLPLYPILAILVGKYWDDYLVMKKANPARWTWKGIDWPIVGFAGLLCLMGVAIPVGVSMYVSDYLLISLVFGLLLLGAGILLLLQFFRGQSERVFWTYSCATICMYLFALFVVIPETDRYRSRKEFFHEVAGIIREQSVIDYQYEGFDVQFYLQRVVPVVRTIEELQTRMSTQTAMFVITTDGSYATLQQKYPALFNKLEVVLERAWTSAFNPKRQRRLLLLKMTDVP